jgi:hypothetical protein
MKLLLFSPNLLAVSLIAINLFGCSPRLSFSSSAKELDSPVAVSTSFQGVTLPKVEAKWQNPWTPELEAEFQQRAKEVLRYYSNIEKYGNGSGENEKSSYPRAMFDFLVGNRKKAIDFLQAEDPEAKKHQHTEGIDYYYCFTLKGQIRKYFLFGQYLDRAYKKRMFSGAKKWTQIDPNNRPHPIYGNGDGSGQDWDISKRGGWVDGRNTDNLRAMRETSVYLMAEETGNEATRLLYKQQIKRYVWALYNIGMGEWDSEVYHGHTFAPYLNLYDFAKDPEVKQLAKAALDWLSAAAAVKYYRGGWGGPVKRDYGGGNVVWGSSAARTFWLYFGDTPPNNPKPELDSLYLITSTYRPPQAVVALARKQFDRPVEILSTKPVYENWKLGADLQPGYWETSFFGNSYQMGSIAGTFADRDVAPFKLMAYNSQRGVDYFVANTDGNSVQPGKNPGDEIGQYRNLLIWLRPASDVPFFFQLPKTAVVEVKQGIWFFRLEKTWLALHPINLNNYRLVTTNQEKYPQEQTLKAIGKGNSYIGFALEVGEEQSDGSFENFQQAQFDRSQLNLKEIGTGRVIFQGISGKKLQFQYNTENLLPIIARDGIEYDRSEHFALYYSPETKKAPISLGWKQGKLKVRAEGEEFSSSVVQ